MTDNLKALSRHLLLVTRYLFVSPLVVLFLIACSLPAYGGLIEYDLLIEYNTVNFTGKEARAMTINGGIPGPTLYWTEGDVVRLRVHNRLDEETSIHWHGILVPNKEDGVSYLTTPPIKPGTTREFSFPVKQSGTYWYHSHTSLQEQSGVYGPIVIYPNGKQTKADREYVLVLSDWTDEDPHEVMRTLKRGSDYYMLKRGSVQSIYDAFRRGALPDVLKRSLERMPPMDISDVGYDLFLINGKKEAVLPAKPGEDVLLRIINASAGTYFYLQFAGGYLKVSSADGQDVKPFDIDRTLIAIAETYDVIVTVPDKGSFELRATAQDGSGSTSAFIGEGDRVFAPDVPKPDLYRMHGAGYEGMNMDMDMKMGMEGHDMHMMHDVGRKPDERPLPPYPYLRSERSTVLPEANPARTITLALDGDMERYVWTINGKVLSEAGPLIVRRGENVRLVFENKSMMHHPMHLHGHFFRVLNDQGEYAPLKHTVDIPPMGKQTIEFYAGEDKDWPLHCHILYHMKAGMFTVLSYEGSEVDPEIAEARKDPANNLKKDPWFFWAEASLLTQMSDVYLNASNTRNTFSIYSEADWHGSYDSEILYLRYINRFLSILAGADIADEEDKGVFGVNYLLPLNIGSRIWADTKKEAGMSLEKKLRITDRLSVAGDVEYDTGTQWEGVVRAEWTLNKYASLVGSYHSDYKGGAGVSVRF
ncbi:MAG: multicopper oxidase domain-containing protein [Nitrospirae bacterium]|nr:multicopper oxidase domain-containing protein [Nitrospirota bacterium]